MKNSTATVLAFLLFFGGMSAAAFGGKHLTSKTHGFTCVYDAEMSNMLATMQNSKETHEVYVCGRKVPN